MKYRLMVLSWTSTALLLSGCERLDYTTWQCEHEKRSEQKMSMKLDGSNLEVLGEKLRFCGSLGMSSYFDTNCPKAVEASKASFKTKTGNLALDQQIYHCKVL
jgi:hypothetical protein